MAGITILARAKGIAILAFRSNRSGGLGRNQMRVFDEVSELLDNIGAYWIAYRHVHL
jgi:hypothetical protein